MVTRRNRQNNRQNRSSRRGRQAGTRGRGGWSRFPANEGTRQVRGMNPEQIPCRVPPMTALPLLITSSAAGLLAGVFALAPNLVSHGAAVPFAELMQRFDEFFFNSIVVRIAAVAANTGETNFWFDENDSTTPTVDDVDCGTNRRLISNSNANSRSATQMTWRNMALEEQDWFSVATESTTVPVTLKFYSDAGSFGNTAAAANMFTLQPTFWLIFRGSGTVTEVALQDGIISTPATIQGPLTVRQIKKAERKMARETAVHALHVPNSPSGSSAVVQHCSLPLDASVLEELIRRVADQLILPMQKK